MRLGIHNFYFYFRLQQIEEDDSNPNSHIHEISLCHKPLVHEIALLSKLNPINN